MRPGDAAHLTLSLALAVVVACAPASGPSPEELPPADQAYTVEGVVEAVHGNSTATLSIHHQPIHDFVDREGKMVGMHGMSMPFPVAAGVEIDGIEAGDPVRFRFEVRWEGDTTLLITEIEELPAGTEVDFSGVGTPG